MHQLSATTLRHLPFTNNRRRVWSAGRSLGRSFSTPMPPPGGCTTHVLLALPSTYYTDGRNASIEAIPQCKISFSLMLEDGINRCTRTLRCLRGAVRLSGF